MAHGFPALKRSVAEKVVRAERSSLKLRKEATAAEQTIPQASLKDLKKAEKEALLVKIVSSLTELQRDTKEVVASIRSVPMGVKAVFDECQQLTPVAAGASPAKSEPEREPEGGRPATPDAGAPLDRAPGAGRAALSESEESLPSSLWYGPAGWRGYSDPWSATLMATPPRGMFAGAPWEEIAREMCDDPERRDAFMQGLRHSGHLDLWLPAPPMTQTSETAAIDEACRE